MISTPMYSPPSLGGIRPRRFGLVPWSPHIAFGYDLVADLRPRMLVELGTHSGEAYFAFCQSVAENRTGTTCYGVDTWQGGLSGDAVYQDVSGHNQEFYKSFSYLVRSTFDDALARFADGSLDLIHFDGLHTYEAIRHDFETWRRKLSPRGVALFHDIAARHNDSGVWKCWEEIRSQGESFEFHHGWGLGVWKPRGGEPVQTPLLRALFSASPAQAENIRHYYVMATDALRQRTREINGSNGHGENGSANEGLGPLALQEWTPTAPRGTAPVAGPELQVFFPVQGDEFREENSECFPLMLNRWERIAVTLPDDWRGQSLRIDPGSGFGLADIAGVRIVSAVMDEVVWELLGGDLLGGVRVLGGAQAVPNPHVLRLLCVEGDPHILLPEIDVQGRDEPMRLEIGIRLRTEMPSFGHTLHEWAREMHDLPEFRARHKELAEELAREREAHQRLTERIAEQETVERATRVNLADTLAKLQTANEQAAALGREVDKARAEGEDRATALLAEVESACQDGRRQVAALHEQLAAVRLEARAHVERLTTEAETIRQDGRRQVEALNEQLAASRLEAQRHAETLTAETETARQDGRRQVEALNEQLAAAHEAAQAHARTLMAEIETARQDGRRQVEALNEQLAASRLEAQRHAETLTAEIETARQDGRRQVEALNEQLAAAHEAAQAHARTLTAEIETIRRDGGQQLAALNEQVAAAQAHANNLISEIATVREDGRRQVEALNSQLAAAQTHARGLAAEIELARADHDARTTALSTEIERLGRQVTEQDHVDGELRHAQEQLAHSQNQLHDTEAELRELREEKVQWEQDREFLHQEISGLHSELQAQDESLVKVGRDHADTFAALMETRVRAEADQGRLSSMRQSASWKLTLPLRAAGRAVTGKRPASRNGTSPAHSNGLLPSAEDMAQRSGGYTFQLDGPADWNLPAQQTRLRGWCLPPAGRRVPGLRVRCGERTVNVRCDVPRPDVQAAHGGNPEWHLCGFDVKLDVPGGPSQLTIEALDEHGKGWLVGQYKVRAPYAAWARQGAVGGNPAEDYATWIDYYDALSAEDRRRIRALARELPHRPLISVVMPVYNTPEKWLAKAIDSVRRQLYPFWELCIADDCSPKAHVREVLARYERLDPRIKVCYREKNGHISAASNSALALATGEFVALLDHDDELAIHALYAVALELQDHPESDLLYSDEDKMDEEGKRFSPYFKPQWNPDLLLGQNFISHLGVYRREVLKTAGGFRVGYEGCQDWDLALRIVEQIPASHIRHIPRILYHWRAIEGSTARAVEEKDYIVEASRRVLEGHCERTGKDTEILPVRGSHFRVRYRLPAPPPLVSIIIPTHNQPRLLRQGIEALRAKTTYPNYEILVVDNRSDDPAALAYLEDLQHRGEARVLRYPQPFNYSAINNFAVEQAGGELVCLMNNDMEVITPDWLEEMASQALRPGIGAVGAILYYPDDTIQHAGVVLGLGGVAGHLFSRMPRETDGYFNRARLVQNFTAVTAACLVVRRSAYREVGGLNEALKVAFNDVDFCLKLHVSGRRNLWTPHAEFYHHESASRGMEDTTEKHQRFVSEVEYMRAHWHEIIADDPAYNLNLGTDNGECRLASPPRLPLLRNHALPEPETATPVARNGQVSGNGVFSH